MSIFFCVFNCCLKMRFFKLWLIFSVGKIFLNFDISWSILFLFDYFAGFNLFELIFIDNQTWCCISFILNFFVIFCLLKIRSVNFISFINYFRLPLFKVIEPLSIPILWSIQWLLNRISSLNWTWYREFIGWFFIIIVAFVILVKST